MAQDVGTVHVLVDLAHPEWQGLPVGITNGLQGTCIITSSYEARAYGIRLNSVSVGEITISNVDAFVLEGAGPDVPLLGMSFLRKLRVSTDNGVMLLEHER